MEAVGGLPVSVVQAVAIAERSQQRVREPDVTLGHPAECFEPLVAMQRLVQAMVDGDGVVGQQRGERVEVCAVIEERRRRQVRADASLELGSDPNQLVEPGEARIHVLRREPLAAVEAAAPLAESLGDDQPAPDAVLSRADDLRQVLGMLDRMDGRLARLST